MLWKQAGTGVGQFVRAVLSEALPAGPVVAGMLQLLLGNLTALKDTCAGLLEQSRGFERQASRSQEVIDKYVKNKEEHDRVSRAQTTTERFWDLGRSAWGRERSRVKAVRRVRPRSCPLHPFRRCMSRWRRC